GFANHIIFNNAVKTTDRFGHANNAYLFNGSSSYMQLAHSSSLNPANITVMSIVKINGFYSGACHGNNIITKGDDKSNGFYGLRFSDNADCALPVDTNAQIFYGAYGNGVLNTSEGSAAVADSVFVRTGQWYTVVNTYDGQDSRLYINGVLKELRHDVASFTANTADLYIGQSGSALHPYWLNGV